MKQMGARNAGNPHVACDVEGAGDVERSRYLGRPARQSSTLPMRGEWKRSHGRATKAPPDERGGNRYVLPNTTAPHLDSTVCHERRLSTTVRNCTRDEGGPFEVGNQVLISSHRKLLTSKAMVVSVAETPGQDSGRQG